MEERLKGQKKSAIKGEDKVLKRELNEIWT
jgi:hypothetical protein